VLRLARYPPALDMDIQPTHLDHDMPRLGQTSIMAKYRMQQSLRLQRQAASGRFIYTRLCYSRAPMPISAVVLPAPAGMQRRQAGSVSVSVSGKSEHSFVHESMT
jgi:hypothetical protein